MANWEEDNTKIRVCRQGQRWGVSRFELPGGESRRRYRREAGAKNSVGEQGKVAETRINRNAFPAIFGLKCGVDTAVPNGLSPKLRQSVIGRVGWAVL